MPLIETTQTTWLILAFTLWPIIQISIALFCKFLPKKIFDYNNFFFKSRRWEKSGQFYEKVFKVKKWKEFLPDGSACFKNEYKKKHMSNFSEENIQKFLYESCKAEWVHLLAIPPFLIFTIFCEFYFVLCMAAYALIVNLPCVLVQRYNRPRLIKILDKKQKKYKEV